MEPPRTKQDEQAVAAVPAFCFEALLEAWRVMSNISALCSLHRAGLIRRAWCLILQNPAGLQNAQCLEQSAQAPNLVLLCRLSLRSGGVPSKQSLPEAAGQLFDDAYTMCLQDLLFSPSPCLVLLAAI